MPPAAAVQVYPFRDRWKRCRFFGDSSRTTADSSTSETLKESFCEIFETSTTKSYACIWNYLEICFFCFYFGHLQEKFLTLIRFSVLEAFLAWAVQRTITNQQCQKVTIVFGGEKFGSKNHICGKFDKRRFFGFYAKTVANSRLWIESVERTR